MLQGRMEVRLRGEDYLRTLPTYVQDAWRPGSDRTPSVEDVLNRDDNSHLLLDGFVGQYEAISHRLVAAVLRRAGSEDVTIDLNTPGGSVSEGMSIYNTINEHRKDESKGRVIINVMGLAGSAGQYMTMASNETRMGTGAFQFIHNSSIIAIGNAGDMESAADVLRKTDSEIADIITNHSNLDRDEVVAMLEKETFINAKEAVDWGLASGYLDGGDEGGGSENSVVDDSKIATAVVNEVVDLTDETTDDHRKAFRMVEALRSVNSLLSES